MHQPTDRIAHTTSFVTPVVEHWLERKIAQWVHTYIHTYIHIYIHTYINTHTHINVNSNNNNNNKTPKTNTNNKQKQTIINSVSVEGDRSQTNHASFKLLHHCNTAAPLTEILTLLRLHCFFFSIATSSFACFPYPTLPPPS